MNIDFDFMGTNLKSEIFTFNYSFPSEPISVAIISQASGKVTETAMLVGSINLVPD